MSLNPGRPKSVRAAVRLEILIRDLDHIGSQGLLEDELGDPIARANHKRLAGVEVLQDDLDLSLVIRVNDSGQSVQTVLYGQS